MGFLFFEINPYTYIDHYFAIMTLGPNLVNKYPGNKYPAIVSTIYD